MATDSVVIPIHPIHETILDIKVLKSLAEITEPIDDLLLYVNPKLSTQQIPDMLKLKPKRIIMNPGAENAAITEAFANSATEVLQACSLVMLRTNQFFK
jgi:predicted CoA-binding protein